MSSRQTLTTENLKSWGAVGMGGFSGPLNRLNAILSLLQPLDRYRALSAIRSAIGRPYLALSRIHAQVQPPRSKPLRGLNRAIVALQCPKPL